MSWADVTICTWDFTKMSFDAIQNGASGTVDSDVEGVVLEVTTTTGSTGGKFHGRGTDAQINKNTVLEIPVKTNKDEITITNYSDPTYRFEYTIGSESVDKTDASYTYVATDADVSAGHATITATCDGYLLKIVVKQNEVAGGSVPARTVKWDWQNANPSTISSVNIVNVKGNVASDVEGVYLEVDATNGGKLWGRGASGSGNDAQFKNAKIYVPVRHEGDVITVVANSGYHHYTIAGTAAGNDTETYTATAADALAGSVCIAATNESYLFSIKVNQVAYTAEATHTHSFTEAWKQTETHHYHVCTAEGCDITDYSAVTGDDAEAVAYGEHVYGSNITLANYYKCKSCDFVNNARKADADAVVPVINLIGAIGNPEDVTSADKAKIKAARDAYDALSDARKELVTNREDLFAAETMYKAQTPVTIPECIAIWNWKDAKDGDEILKETNIKGAIGSISSNVQGLNLDVYPNGFSGYFVATQSGAVYYATLSGGSSLRVPIRRIGDEVLILCPAGQNNYYIKTSDSGVEDVAASDLPTKVIDKNTYRVYTATMKDVEYGYVEIVASSSNRFYEIRSVQPEFKDVLPMISFNAYGWASFTCLWKDARNGQSVALPSTVKAYVATSFDPGDGDYGTVTLTEVKRFAYGEGVFVHGPNYGEAFGKIVEAESTVPSVENNMTIGCTSDVMLYTDSKAYVIASRVDDDEKAGFYHVNTAIKVPAGKAYFDASAYLNQAKALRIVFENGEEATGIESVIAGAMTEAPTVFYNLSGQKVGKDYKGIVVSNDGKKYVK